MIRIPFNRPLVLGDEWAQMRQALAEGHISGDGGFTRRCARLLEALLPGARVLLTPSCTHALEMAALLLDLGPGDEVLVPSFSFPSTVNAFVLRGAQPVFIDIRADTLNLDESQIERRLTPRTRAIFLTHYGGVGCAMDAIGEIADRHGLAVVEDNAHGLLGRYRGRPLGTFGRLAALSFHETKNFTCGEGGALVVNDPALVERAEIIREKGTDRSQFFRGAVDKYTWRDVGSSYVLSDLLAAYLHAQLEARERIQERRRHLWRRYQAALEAWCVAADIRQPVIPADCEPAYHLYHLVLPSLAARTRLLDHLRRRGILAVFHYLPLHRSPMGRRLGGDSACCPVTDDISDRLVRLPLYYDLSDAEQAEVIEALEAFDPHAAAVAG